MATNAERAATLVRALEASITGDTSHVAELYLDDVKGWAPAMSVSSAAELAVELEDRDGAFSDIELDVSPFDVSGERACVEWVVSLTHSGPLEIDDDTVIDPTGLRVTLHGVTVAEFAGEKIAAFRQYWDEVELIQEITQRDAAARVLVFSSADPDFFLMHGDVHGILAIPPGTPPRATGPNVAAALFERLHRSHLVSIATVDGAARGGGAEFLAAVDLRFGSERAVLGQPEVAMGILPGAGGTARLPHLLGRGRALDVILTGRDVGAEEAARIGWLDRVLPHEALGREARAVARHVAAMPPASIAAVKRVVDTTLSSFEQALVDETDAFGVLTAAGAHVAPMQRFLQSGGQTREGETTRWEEIMRATRDEPPG